MSVLLQSLDLCLGPVQLKHNFFLATIAFLSSTLATFIHSRQPWFTSSQYTQAHFRELVVNTLSRLPLIRTEVEPTKLRIVYDASVPENNQVPSLNDCLYAGPLLQNPSWNVLVRMRFDPVAITGPIKQALLQVQIKKEERDSLGFHWKSHEQSEVETLGFT